MENKMIEKGFNYADSTVKEMTDLFETRVENLEPREDRKKSSSASKKPNKPSRRGKGKTPTPVSWSPVMNQQKLAVQPVILRIIAVIYMQW